MIKFLTTPLWKESERQKKRKPVNTLESFVAGAYFGALTGVSFSALFVGKQCAELIEAGLVVGGEKYLQQTYQFIANMTITSYTILGIFFLFMAACARQSILDRKKEELGKTKTETQ
jgi:hypothetical protein